jgi:BirA family biotin operon repressor/biotin-[acetyl-CoA-carboxylase] ligase
MKIIQLDEVDSTNNYCKMLQDKSDVIVTAKRQTAGRGTKGRSFISDEGGLYITIMRTFKDFNGANTFKIMINGCVAVCRTVEKFGVEPHIRWANDVLVCNKKICGTLIENTFLSDGSMRSIVGIGLNVSNKLTGDLLSIATTLNEHTKQNVTVDQVRDELIKNLQCDYSVEDYKKYINWFNSQITLYKNEQPIKAIALDVENDGRFVCLIDGKVEKISSGEVGLRL